MKRIVSLSLILIMMISLVSSVYAESSFTLSLKPNKTEVSKDEEFSVEVRLSNLKQGEKGIIALAGTLEYDQSSLEYVKMEGQGEWDKPTYSDESKIFSTTRNGYAESNEAIFKIVFKVKEQSKQNLEIKLKEITASNGTADIEINDVKTNVTVKSTTTIPDIVIPDNNTTSGPTIDTGDGNDTIKDGPTSGNNNNNANNNNNTPVVNKPLPNTGSSDNLVIVAIAIMSITAVTSFIKMRKIDKEM